MSTTAWHILELAKGLPPEEQRFICSALSRQAALPRQSRRPDFLHTPAGECRNPAGVPNDDPFFRLVEQIEEDRHRTPGRPLPELA